MRVKISVILSLLAIIFIIMLFHGKNGFIAAKDAVSVNPQNLLAKIQKLPTEAPVPALRGIEGWINSKPLSAADLRGKVTLIDFWTYSCVNCVRTLPHVNEWYLKYKNNGFVVLGVHSPEFDFEKKKENVKAAIKKYGVKYPVALDGDHKTWDAFGNQYWPAHYLIDAKGNIRYRSFGEGRYAETEAAIQNLLLEAGLLTLDKITEIKEPPQDANFQNIGTPEIYLGYARINNAGNVDERVKPDSSHLFSEPADFSDNRFYFSGDWIVKREFSELFGKSGKLILRYKADKVNIVAESKDGKVIPLKIFIDGKSKGTTPVSSPQLYNIADGTGDGNWHTLEIRIAGSGFRAFTFTFG